MWPQFIVLVTGVYIFHWTEGFQYTGGYSTETNGTLSTPNYPATYAHDLHRIWLIEAPTKYGIELHLGPVSGEKDKDGNCVDYVEVRDGSSKSKVLLQSCVSTTTTIVKSTSRWLWIRFKANWVVQSTGFQANWNRYNRTDNDEEISPIPHCRGIEIRCPNQDCVPMAWRCDGYNNCGFDGTGSDEDWWCFTKPMSGGQKMAYGIGIGVFLFILLVILIAWLEGMFMGHGGRCCAGPKACFKGLSRPRTRQVPSHSGPTPAMLLITGQHDKFEQLAAEEWQKKAEAYEKNRRRASAISIASLTEDLEAVRHLSVRSTPEPEVHELDIPHTPETRPASVQRRGRERLQQLKSARDEIPEEPISRSKPLLKVKGSKPQNTEKIPTEDKQPKGKSQNNKDVAKSADSKKLKTTDTETESTDGKKLKKEDSEKIPIEEKKKKSTLEKVTRDGEKTEVKKPKSKVQKNDDEELLTNEIKKPKKTGGLIKRRTSKNIVDPSAE